MILAVIYLRPEFCVYFIRKVLSESRKSDPFLLGPAYWQPGVVLMDNREQFSGNKEIDTMINHYVHREYRIMKDRHLI